MIFVVLLSVIVGSLCYAAESKWTLMNETKHTALYLDTDSITSATLNGIAIKTFKAKLLDKSLHNYSLNGVYMNQETKNWMIVHEDRYDQKGKLTETHEYSTDGQWNTYQDPLWKPVLDKVLIGLR